MTTKFFFCKHCGNVVVKFVDSGVIPVCCGEEMVELKANSFEGVGEKHLPVIEKVNDCTVRVRVGSTLHPAEPQHHIVFIYLETQHGGQLRMLDPTGKPEAFFCGCKDKITAVYSYCNIHGLWGLDCKGKFDDLKCACDDGGCTDGTCDTGNTCDTGGKKKGCCGTSKGGKSECRDSGSAKKCCSNGILSFFHCR